MVIILGIVTRAAMKAMAENMHIFLPVIQEAVDKIAADVQAQRQAVSIPKKSKSHKSQTQHTRQPDESNKNIPDDSSIDTSSTEEKKQPTQATQTIRPITQSSPPVQIQGSKTPLTPQPGKQLPTSSSEKSRGQLPPAILTNAIQLPRSPQRVKKHKEIAHQQQQQQQQQSKQSPKQRYATKYVRRIVPYRVAILLLGLILSITCIWQVWTFIRRSNAITATYTCNHLDETMTTSVLSTKESSSARQVKMMYLRDIENGVISSSLRPIYADSERYMGKVEKDSY